MSDIVEGTKVLGSHLRLRTLVDDSDLEASIIVTFSVDFLPLNTVFRTVGRTATIPRAHPTF